jgi:hypothetical protein
MKSFVELLLTKLFVACVRRRMSSTGKEVDMSVVIEIEAQQKDQKDEEIEIETETETGTAQDEDTAVVQSLMPTKLIAGKLWPIEKHDTERPRLQAYHHQGLQEMIEMSEIETRGTGVQQGMIAEKEMMVKGIGLLEEAPRTSLTMVITKSGVGKETSVEGPGVGARPALAEIVRYVMKSISSSQLDKSKIDKTI